MNLSFLFPYIPLLTLTLTILGIIIRTDRRISKLELLMENHLQHHEKFEADLKELLKRD